jgi:tRNA pseudouridine55 synthase
MPTPKIIITFKPENISSQDLVRKIKHHPDVKKIGHFGTLDPFACGTFLMGINGAQRLNELIHNKMPKTYLAKGKLGEQMSTGDRQGEIINIDETDYLNQNGASWDKDFLQKEVLDPFLGTYMQAPHKYSAAKFEGKPLHQWAREGVDIQKEKVPRKIFDIELLEYEFPYFTFRVTVSSGTYVRSLFEDIAKKLGTFGHLIYLERECIGHNGISKGENDKWLSPDDVLLLPKVFFEKKEEALILNGVQLRIEQSKMFEDSNDSLFWAYGNSLLGLVEKRDQQWHPRIIWK